MGSLCCCPCVDEFEEYALPSNSVYRHCACLRYFFHQLFSGYNAPFQRLDGRSVPSPIQGATSSVSSGTGTTVANNSSNDTQFSVARPSPFDADQRYSRLQRDGLSTVGSGKKRSGVDTEEDCKLGQSETSEKDLASKLGYGLTYVQPVSDDDDVCPTCLDEYTPENPKITTRCSHHFHLGCIYEWLERSESCPICGKEMEFCESP
ncbi:hypothetical protein M0R45_021392 [Rubus argutus]|uniref:RING-type E3 ubiquitin transferase n=1 Tax=Rubus argutus TaxID=59490 RepID=A0AAW1XCZ0_RUBAR